MTYYTLDLFIKYFILVLFILYFILDFINLIGFVLFTLFVGSFILLHFIKMLKFHRLVTSLTVRPIEIEETLPRFLFPFSIWLIHHRTVITLDSRTVQLYPYCTERHGACTRAMSPSTVIVYSLYDSLGLFYLLNPRLGSILLQVLTSLLPI